MVFYKARGLYRSRLGWLSALVGFMALGLSLPGCNGKSVAVTAIVINPENSNILFIATNDAIYKSRDGGAAWIPLTQGLGHARILSLAVH
ncbi:MAG: hypothetical protein HY349_03615, partial [Nitrospirae bacterium]|nr:hypothetical protein [Nitrospirota bacterium]